MVVQKRRHGLPYRRKREGKTDYHLRLRLLQGAHPRFVIRRTLKNVYAQIVEYHADGDKVLLTTSTQELKKTYGWKGATRNIPAAYLTGYLLAKKAKKSNITKAIADLGMQKAIKGALVFAVVKGAVDGGLHIPHDAKIFPSDDRIHGKHMKSSPLKEVKENIDRNIK